MGNNVHDIIKAERKKRGIPPMYWSREMAHLAQSQANYCAKVGHMVHSDRYAFQGGENLCGGKGNFSPRTIVNIWLKSKAGHREYLLSPRVTKAGVGIAKQNGKMFYAWAFSDASPSYPDCPRYKGRKSSFKLPSIKFRRQGMLRILIGIFGLWLVVLGIHGLYIHFNMWEVIWSASSANKLFLTVKVPSPLDSWVFWMSNKGYQSFFVPSGVGIGGLVLMYWTGFTSSLSVLLKKLRLW